MSFGNDGGAPRLFKSKESLQIAIDDYFKNLPVHEEFSGDKVIEKRVATITGLVLHLGFCDRRSFYDYEKLGEFSHIIKTARTRIENYYETKMNISHLGQTGCIFALKSFGWDDGRANNEKEETEEAQSVKIIIEDARIKIEKNENKDNSE